MNVAPPSERSGGPPPAAALIWKAKVRIALSVLITGAILFASAGRLDWLMAWVYLGLFVACMVATLRLLARSPELLAERMGIKPGAKRWDIPLVVLMAVQLPAIMLVVAGFDERFGWSPEQPLPVQIAALAPMVLGYLLVLWSMASNKFFSALIRVQQDRGHHVVSTGPYRYARHPGYVGALMFLLPTPLVLGSLWALIPSGLILGVTVVRTALEDRTLKKELEGYREYAGRVRYRLLPGVW